jgi:hypothetical protein
MESNLWRADPDTWLRARTNTYGMGYYEHIMDCMVDALLTSHSPILITTTLVSEEYCFKEKPMPPHRYLGAASAISMVNLEPMKLSLI